MITTALIGSPVEHSVSPTLFSLYAQEHDLEYAHSKFDVKVEDLRTVIKALPAYGFAGVNITLPYKTEVIQYLDALSPEAVAIGAVNTIKISKGKLHGYNTDSYGAVRAIEKAVKRQLSSSDSAIVFGTGGAARAIIWGLLQKEVNVLVIYREPVSLRTLSVKGDFSSRVTFKTYSDLDSHSFKDITLICNATSAGMSPDITDSPIDLSIFKNVDLSCTLVFDAIFNPTTTKFQTYAQACGATLAHGIDMMVYQGAVAFEHWTNKKVSDEVAQNAAYILMKYN